MIDIILYQPEIPQIQGTLADYVPFPKAAYTSFIRLASRLQIKIYAGLGWITGNILMF